MIGIFICTSLVVLTMACLLRCYPGKTNVPYGALDKRPLGSIEQVMMNLGRIGVMQIVRTVIFSSVKPISIKNVERVLYRLAARHPLLRMKIKKYIFKGITSDWFVPMENIIIKLEELPDKVWLDVMEKQLSDTEINTEDGPLWHVKFLPNINHEETEINLSHQCAMIFVFNHAICDANSMLHLINETLSNLENELTEVKHFEKIESLPLPNSLSDIAGIESRRPFSHELFQLLISLFPFILWLAMTLIHKDRSTWIRRFKKKHSNVSGTGIVAKCFNKSETEIFLHSCKVHSVSPLAAFQAASVTILADKLAISREVQFGTTVNLRSYYNECKNNIYREVASYSAFLDCKVKILEEKGDFWKLAQNCKNAVHEDLVARTEKQMQLMSVLRMVPGGVISKLNNVTSLFSFGNLGNCSFLNRNDDSHVRVIAVYGTGSIHRGPMPLFCAHLIYFEKRFLWNLSYSTSNISKEAAAIVAENIKQKIIEETVCK